MKSASSQKSTRAFLVNGILALIVLLWLIPVIGIFVSSFRQRFDIQTSPWWNVLPHRDWVATKTINPRELGLDANGPMTVEGVTATFEEMRAGVEEGRYTSGLDRQPAHWQNRDPEKGLGYDSRSELWITINRFCRGRTSKSRTPMEPWKRCAAMIFRALCSTA